MLFLNNFKPLKAKSCHLIITRFFSLSKMRSSTKKYFKPNNISKKENAFLLFVFSKIVPLVTVVVSLFTVYIKDKELHYYKVKSFKVESEMALLKAEMAQIKTKSIAIKSEVVSNESRTWYTWCSEWCTSIYDGTVWVAQQPETYDSVMWGSIVMLLCGAVVVSQNGGFYNLWNSLWNGRNGPGGGSGGTGSSSRLSDLKIDTDVIRDNVSQVSPDIESISPRSLEILPDYNSPLIEKLVEPEILNPEATFRIFNMMEKTPIIDVITQIGENGSAGPF